MQLNKATEQRKRNPMEWTRKCVCGRILKIDEEKFCSKCPRLYMNKEWLVEQYYEEGLTLQEIAKKAGASYVTIWTWMNKLDIPRERRHFVHPSYRIKLTPTLVEFLEGLLLGDGCISIGSPQSGYYCHTDKHYDFMIWLASKLSGMGMKYNGKIREYDTGRSIVYRYRSRYYIDLLTLRHKWYPNGKKAIPRSFIATPTRLKYWYIGDGSISSSYPVIDSSIFTVRSMGSISNQLRLLGIHSKIYQQQSRLRLKIARKSINDFLYFILSSDPEIPPGYEYKFKGA